jgi:hypothetical protein
MEYRVSLLPRLSYDLARHHCKKNNKNKNKKQLPTIRHIPDKVWNEVKGILPKEKPLRTVVGRPSVPYRTVLDGILYVLNNRVPVENTTKRVWLRFYYLPS